MHRVSLVGVPGSGKTTVGRQLAASLGVPFVELDAIFHQPGWGELPRDDFRERVSEVLTADGWVVDGNYSAVQDLVWRRADTVVWLDLPMCVWLPRLFRRTIRRLLRREELWAGNRESIRGAFLGRDALIPWTLRNYRRRRRAYPEALAPYRHVRLRTSRDVERFLRGL